MYKKKVSIVDEAFRRSFPDERIKSTAKEYKTATVIVAKEKVCSVFIYVINAV